MNVQLLILFQNREYMTGQISDLSEKLEQAETQLSRAAPSSYAFDTQDRRVEDKLAKAAKDRFEYCLSLCYLARVASP